jgi:DNA-binding IclR family transcriptional regulator
VDTTSRTTELVAKTITILRVVASNPGCGLSEISRKASIPKATALRILNSFRNQSIIWLDEDKEYRLGLGALALSPVGFDRRMMDAQVSDELEQLALQVGETTGFDVFVGGSVVVLIQASGPQLIGQVPNKAPFSQESWCTSTGRLFLSYLSTAELKQNHKTALAAFAKNRPGRNLIEELSVIRSQGYSTTEGELAVGASAIAVPVFHGKKVVASVWAGGPTDRFRKHDLNEMKKSLLTTSANIGQVLASIWTEAESQWNEGNPT